MSKNWGTNLPLHEAIASGDFRTFKFLLSVTEKVRIANKSKDEKYIMSVDLPGFNNMVPLQQAMAANKTDILNYLLASECNLDHRDSTGNTVLHLAVVSNNIDITRRILAAPNFSAKLLLIENNIGDSPLVLAAKFSNISILKQLDFAINIAQYVQKSTGNTMLHIAAIQGNVENVKFFILSGLDPLKKNNQNKNAFDFVPKHQLQSFLQSKRPKTEETL